MLSIDILGFKIILQFYVLKILQEKYILIEFGIIIIYENKNF